MSFDVKTASMTLPLAMRHMGQERKALENRLNDLVNQYVPELDGILIKWHDLSILSDRGIICSDQPYIFWKVSFMARTFKPSDGKVVQGRVHRLLKNYFIGVALNSFTVTVSIPETLLTHEVVTNLTVQQDVYIKIKGDTEGTYKGEFDEECIELTRIHMKEEADKSSGDVYSYAKDFEY